MGSFYYRSKELHDEVAHMAADPHQPPLCSITSPGPHQYTHNTSSYMTHCSGHLHLILRFYTT